MWHEILLSEILRYMEGLKQLGSFNTVEANDINGTDDSQHLRWLELWPLLVR